jgi:hypothetical protein
MRNTLLKLTAAFLPGIYFIIQRNLKAGAVCLVLQLSVIGWLPASLWASMNLEDNSRKKRIEKYLKDIHEYRS